MSLNWFFVFKVLMGLTDSIVIERNACSKRH
jgi:hypothetical protein